MALLHTAPDTLPDPGVLRRDAVLRPEARYRALIGVLPDVLVVVFDPDLRVLSLEGGGLDRLPMPASAVVGRHLDEFLSPEQLPRVEPHLRAAMRGEGSAFDFQGSNGVTWAVQLVPIVEADGRPGGSVAQFRDVTEQRAADRALAEHARALEGSNAELEEYAYVASHDLSEPLRMVDGYLRLLQRRYGDELDADAGQFIEFALGGAQRMRALIDDLLACSRLGTAPPDPAPVDLQATVEDLWRTLTAGRDLPGPTLLTTGLPVVMGDAGQLRQALQNLLSNALKFVHPGREAVVEVTGRLMAGGGWELTVQDQGIGFEDEDPDRAFRMFTRLHSHDEYPGTGVGLAIARKVVEAHGGRISADNRPGGGARFRVELPATA